MKCVLLSRFIHESFEFEGAPNGSVSNVYKRPETVAKCPLAVLPGVPHVLPQMLEADCCMKLVRYLANCF
jgi:hypothetical protein